MKIIFIHDHKFKIDQQGKYYTDGKFTNELFDRYIFEDSDEVVVIARRIAIHTLSKNLNEVDHSQVKFNCVKGINPIQIFIFNFLYNIKILNLVLKSDLNIIRLPSFLGLFCCFLCILFNKKYFVEVVGHTRDSLIDNNSKLLKKIFANVYSYFTKIVIEKSTGAIYVTKNALQVDYPCNGITDYASNVILKVKENHNPKVSYEIDGIPKVGLIGSFNNGYKGIDFAIHIVAYLLHSHNLKVHLHILGHGNLLEEYQNLAISLNVNQQIFFDGLRPLEQVPMWLNEMDIYIQPSLTEGLPRSLIEAMSRGLPCIASNVGGIPELLPMNSIFTEFNESLVSDMLIHLLKDLQLREKLGNQNFLQSLNYCFEHLENKRRNFWYAARTIKGAQ